MTVRELIIETQLQVKRLAAHRRDSINEQNIIWRLNTAQDRLIRDAIEPDPNNPNRFLINEVSNNLIQKLIKPNVSLTTYQESSKRGFAYLPSDLGYLLNERGIIVEDCNKEQWATPTETVTLNCTVIGFSDSILSSPNYYKTIGLKTTLGSNTAVTTYNTNGTQSKKEKYELVQYIMRLWEAQPLEKPVKAYWEKFDTLYFPESFILVAEQGNPTLDLVIDGAELSRFSNTLTNVKIKPYSAGNEVPMRGYKGDFLFDAISYNYYEQPTPDSPVTQLADDKIYFYSSKRFLVSQLVVDYIRKPRRISLYLNQTCELDSNVHEKVCSLAAEAILGNVEASNYPLKVQENITRT